MVKNLKIKYYVFKSDVMKVLISSKSFGTDSNSMSLLKDAGFETIINQRKKLEFDEFIEFIKDADGLIAGTEKITKELLDHAKSLKVISRFGVGMDNIDLNAAAEKKIIVLNTPSAPTDAVAELTVALILNLERKISEVDRSMHSGSWNPLMGSLLRGKTFGVVGLGRIGKEVVRLLSPFGLKIVAYEPYPDELFIKEYNIKLLSFHEVISHSDIISLHVPLTETTCHMISDNEFSIMKKSVLLVNTARGSLINEDALIKALEQKTIYGAALDVFEKEPYNGELKKFDNVILTPHVGSLTNETRIKMEREAVDNLINAIKDVKK